MNYLFTVCGRAGSKGVCGKNTRDLNGIPLVWYTLAAIKTYRDKYAANDGVDVVLNTDSEELIRLVERVKDLSVSVIKRDETLAGDRVPKVAVIQNCLLETEKRTGKTYDVVIDLDITSPLRSPEDIQNAVNKKTSRDDTDVVYSVTHARRNPYFNMVCEKDGFFVRPFPGRFTTRQEAPVFYDLNASIYAYSPKALKTKDSVTFFNDRADAILMTDTGILDIDSEEDYYLMQAIVTYFLDNHAAYAETAACLRSWKQAY